MSEMIMSESDRQQLLNLFAAEAEENLASFEDLLLQLEAAPQQIELLHDIFRAAHTLKGSASCLQFNELTAFAHVVEGTLDRLRNREVDVTPQRISQLLNAVDALRDLSARSVAGNCMLTIGEKELLASLSGSAVEPKTQTPAVTPSNANAIRSARSLRVDMEKLDRMLDLTGEITIARGRVHDLIAAAESRERLVDAVREVDRLSRSLQELVMSARLVPVGPALRHFHRVVRDLAAGGQKRVNLVIEGNEVEIDATALEHLKDPITHMIRNAVDHGIEKPEDRVAHGKSATGTITITAAHESGAVVIRIADDGRGISEIEIEKRARAAGIDTERLSRREVLGLIFQPGFSTAKKVTEVSGRGVGMDVVLRNVHALRGTVSIASQPGVGTTITLRLPLTIALIEGFAVSVGEETYILPIDSIVECVELPADSGSDACGVLRLRGVPIPFVRLRQLFHLDTPSPARENVIIVEREEEEQRAGIVVDALIGAKQTVMKPMSRLLQRPIGVAGSSILGNGRVALILDPEEIARLAAA